MTELTVEVATTRQDETIAPLAGATVRATTLDGRASLETTDERGMAILDNLPRETVMLTVSSVGMKTDTRELQLRDDRQNVRVILVPSVGRLTISVLGVDEATAAPVAGADVRLKPEGGQARSLPRTDQQGVVTAENVPLGKLTITVIATGWETEVTPFQMGAEDAAVEIRLSKQLPPEDGA